MCCFSLIIDKSDENVLILRNKQINCFCLGDAEIVSMDAFTRLHGSGVVVGITFIKVPFADSFAKSCAVAMICRTID